MATLRHILDKKTVIDLEAYGTSDGVTKAWDTRGRGKKEGTVPLSSGKPGRVSYGKEPEKVAIARTLARPENVGNKAFMNQWKHKFTPADQGARAAKRDTLVSMLRQKGWSHPKIRKELGMDKKEYDQTYRVDPKF